MMYADHVRSAIRMAGLSLLLMCTPFAAQSQGLAINTKDGLSYRSAEGNFAVKLGGRWHYDGARFYFEGDEQVDETWAVRRLYASLRVDMFKDWRLSMQYDLAAKKAPFESLWLRYSGLPALNITFGQIGEPFSLEESTSSNVIPFMERALPNALTPGDNVGLLLNSSGSRWTTAVGAFWETYIEDSDLFNEAEGRAVTGRLTFLPVDHGKDFLHLGMSASWRWPDDSDRVRFRTRPEAYVGKQRLISSGRIRDVQNYLTTGLESALALGPLTLQGEYIQTNLFFIDEAKENETLDGGYVYAGLFLTGEQRSYSRSRGVFGKIEPRGRQGAWELAARYSYLDLNGRSILGGREDNVTLGLNWYASSALRLMFNVIKVDTDANAGDLDPVIIQMRLQVAI